MVVVQFDQVWWVLIGGREIRSSARAQIGRPIETGAVVFTAAGAVEPVLDFETRVPKIDEHGVMFFTPLDLRRGKFGHLVRALTLRARALVGRPRHG
jgi:hypothetical protein